MLPVETELHLRVKVAGERLGINDVASWSRGAGGEIARELISGLLLQVQTQHAERVRRGEAEVVCTRCGVVHSGLTVVRRGSRQRKVRTSSGLVVFRLLQWTCTACRKTWSPYPDLLGLAPRRRVSEELLKELFEGVVQLSYARSAKLAQAWLGSTVSSRTLHRTVQERAGQIRFTEAAGLDTIVADGSLVKAGAKKRGEEYCVSFQIQDRVQVHGRTHVPKRVIGFGFGPWGWYEAFRNTTPPKLVVTDGEQGIRECVAACYPKARHQLCEWHIPYTLNILLLLDGRTGNPIPLARRKRMLGKLRGILGRRDQEAYARFTRRLKAGSHSRTYLEGVQRFVMYRRPSKVRTTSWAERQMRELNRRTDVGVRWSLQGVAHMLALLLAKLHNHDDYERIWTQPNPLVHNLVPLG